MGRKMLFLYFISLSVGCSQRKVWLHMNYRVKYLSLILLLALPSGLSAQKIQFRFKSQVSMWTTVNHTSSSSYQAGIRYIPWLSVTDTLRNGHMLDAELSVNGYGDLLFTGAGLDSAHAAISPYRFWIRYSGAHFEVRLGLQKINFGSATILRPLMWFDRMDYRDPLQLTDGVYGALGRYYFRGNANIWLWVIYGENKVKGWEMAPSLNKSPEIWRQASAARFKGRNRAQFSSQGNRLLFILPVYTPYRTFTLP